MTEPKLKRPPGRPRCTETRQCILEAANDLLEQEGFEAVTMERLAAEAGVGKTTIYRRWPNSCAVVMDAFLEANEPKFLFKGTGSAREDLHQQMQKLTAVMMGKTGEILRSLIAAGQCDPELLASFRSQFLEPRRAAARAVIEQGIEYGEFSPDIDVDVAMDTLYGPLYYRLLMEHRPLTAEFVTILANQVIQGLGTQ